VSFLSLYVSLLAALECLIIAQDSFDLFFEIDNLSVLLWLIYVLL